MLILRPYFPFCVVNVPSSLKPNTGQRDDKLSLKEIAVAQKDDHETPTSTCECKRGVNRKCCQSYPYIEEFPTTMRQMRTLTYTIHRTAKQSAKLSTHKSETTTPIVEAPKSVWQRFYYLKKAQKTVRCWRITTKPVGEVPNFMEAFPLFGGSSDNCATPEINDNEPNRRSAEFF